MEYVSRGIRVNWKIVSILPLSPISARQFTHINTALLTYAFTYSRYAGDGKAAGGAPPRPGETAPPRPPGIRAAEGGPAGAARAAESRGAHRQQARIRGAPRGR
eukprot:1180524-Prorocentrum_minimum.AAC.2